jgi:small subunit ribosomal protein S13
MVLKEASINPDTRVKELSEEDVKKLQTIIEKNFKVEGDLKEEINNNIKRLREIGAYRGIRHLRGLPARGQRTKSNARTRRGKRRTVGALKKEDMLRLQAAATKK